MRGPRITTVFRSKWRALWFAASVLDGVWFSVPEEGEKADPAQQQGVEVWEVPVPARRSTAKRGGTGRWRDRVGALRDVIGLAVRRDDYSGPQGAGADLVLPGRHPIP